jgi:hypothetical protein
VLGPALEAVAAGRHVAAAGVALDLGRVDEGRATNSAKSEYSSNVQDG